MSCKSAGYYALTSTALTCAQFGVCLFGCDQSDVVAHVRHDQYIRSVPATASALP